MGLEEIRKIKSGAGLPKTKDRKPIAKISDKRKKKLAVLAASNTDNAVDLWFEARRMEMTGRCLFCNGKTEKNNDATYRSSIAHLLPKKDSLGGLPSVATHRDNWLELCHFGNSCHTNFDNGYITWEFLHGSNEWNVISEKFKKIYPFIPEDEKKFIPDFLLKSIP